MRLSLRFVIPLLLALAAFAYAVVPLVDKLTMRWFVSDLDMRASLIATTVQEPVQDLLRTGNRTRAVEFFTRITQDERLYAIGFCPARRGQPVATPALPPEVNCRALDQFSGPAGHMLTSAQGPVLVSVRPLDVRGGHGREAGARARHELRRRAAARRRESTCSTSSSASALTVSLHHGGHRAAELARLGAGPARAAAGRGAVAAHRTGPTGRSFARSPATCAR